MMILQWMGLEIRIVVLAGVIGPIRFRDPVLRKNKT